MNLAELRRSSLGRAKALGASVPMHLPLLDDPLPSIDKGAIVSRLLAMHAVAAAAYGFPIPRALAWARSVGVTESFTPGEHRFLDTGVGHKHQFQEQIEAMWALAWALSIVPALELAKSCSTSFVKVLPSLKAGESADQLRAQARLRPASELLEAADLAYLLHWAVRDAAIRGLPATPDIEEYVITERRRALEWLLYGGAWEDVSLDT